MANKHRLRSYFVDAEPAAASDVEVDLWNRRLNAEDFDRAEKYQAAILDQYKLYVEMADRVSARRGLANTFFLTLNTAVFAAIGLFWKDRPHADPWTLAFPLVVLVGQCLTWFWIVRSYRQLSSGKWAVVGALERRLPASPWWNAEWKALGEGEDPAKYWPLTHVEQLIPLLFGVTYVMGFLAVVLF